MAEERREMERLMKETVEGGKRWRARIRDEMLYSRMLRHRPREVRATGCCHSGKGGRRGAAISTLMEESCRKCAT